MRIAEIVNAVRARPFRRFVLKTADGGRYEVPHPEFVAVNPRSERTVIVTTGPDEHAVLDAMLISAIEFERDGGGEMAEAG